MHASDLYCIISSECLNPNFKYHQPGQLWTAGRLWTIFQHLCIVSVQRISAWNVSYCEDQLPISKTWLLHCEILHTTSIQRCWKIVPKSPWLTSHLLKLNMKQPRYQCWKVQPLKSKVAFSMGILLCKQFNADFCHIGNWMCCYTVFENMQLLILRVRIFWPWYLGHFLLDF